VQGQLVILASGSQSLFRELEDREFAAMGKQSFFFGDEYGQGARAKLTINMV
jgi:3-hydroxyisobutyrate dehydrogenase-like beta-hydroxyacid dehydrogenase